MAFTKDKELACADPNTHIVESENEHVVIELNPRIESLLELFRKEVTDTIIVGYSSRVAHVAYNGAHVTS